MNGGVGGGRSRWGKFSFEGVGVQSTSRDGGQSRSPTGHPDGAPATFQALGHLGREVSFLRIRRDRMWAGRGRQGEDIVQRCCRGLGRVSGDVPFLQGLCVPPPHPAPCPGELRRTNFVKGGCHKCPEGPRSSAGEARGTRGGLGARLSQSQSPCH